MSGPRRAFPEGRGLFFGHFHRAVAQSSQGTAIIPPVSSLSAINDLAPMPLRVGAFCWSMPDFLMAARRPRSSFIGAPHYLPTLAEIVPRNFHEGPSVSCLSRRMSDNLLERAGPGRFSSGRGLFFGPKYQAPNID